MAYLQNNSAFIPNSLTRYLQHSNQCDETNCSLAKRFGDAESYAQCPIYYDQRPVLLLIGQSVVQFIEVFRSMTNCRICRRIVMEHWPNANEKRCSSSSLNGSSDFVTVLRLFCSLFTAIVRSTLYPVLLSAVPLTPPPPSPLCSLSVTHYDTLCDTLYDTLCDTLYDTSISPCVRQARRGAAGLLHKPMVPGLTPAAASRPFHQLRSARWDQRTLLQRMQTFMTQRGTPLSVPAALDFKEGQCRIVTVCFLYL